MLIRVVRGFIARVHKALLRKFLFSFWIFFIHLICGIIASASKYIGARTMSMHNIAAVYPVCRFCRFRCVPAQVLLGARPTHEGWWTALLRTNISNFHWSVLILCKDGALSLCHAFHYYLFSCIGCGYVWQWNSSMCSALQLVSWSVWSPAKCATYDFKWGWFNNGLREPKSTYNYALVGATMELGNQKCPHVGTELVPTWC